MGWGGVRSPEKVIGSIDFRSNCWHTRGYVEKNRKKWGDDGIWLWRLFPSAILDKDKP